MTDTKHREIAEHPAVKALLDYKQADRDGVVVLVSRQAIHEVVDLIAASHSQGVEDAARCAAGWRDPSAIRLAAGEMTAQEMRAAQAVAAGIEAAIRALLDTPSGDTGDGWSYDMEAAPRDGTSILTVGVDSPHVTETRYLPNGLFIPATHNSRSFQKPAGWYWAGWDGAVGPVRPTAWMPLPTPPGGDRHGK